MAHPASSIYTASRRWSNSAPVLQRTMASPASARRSGSDTPSNAAEPARRRPHGAAGSRRRRSRWAAFAGFGSPHAQSSPLGLCCAAGPPPWLGRRKGVCRWGLGRAQHRAFAGDAPYFDRCPCPFRPQSVLWRGFTPCAPLAWNNKRERAAQQQDSWRNSAPMARVNIEMNRCTACYRCLQYYRDYAGDIDLDAFDSRRSTWLASVRG